MKSINEYRKIEERRTIQVKRKYGSFTPISVGVNAPIRNKVLKFISSQTSRTKAEITEYITKSNKQTGAQRNVAKWLKKNEKYLKLIKTKGKISYKLSKLGYRVIKHAINEGMFSGLEDLGELEDMIYDQGDIGDVKDWEKEVEDMLDGGDSWEDLDEPDLVDAISTAKKFVKKKRFSFFRRR